jgi:hypothetical protein
MELVKTQSIEANDAVEQFESEGEFVLDAGKQLEIRGDMVSDKGLIIIVPKDKLWRINVIVYVTEVDDTTATAEKWKEKRNG